MADPGFGDFVARGIRARRGWLRIDQAELGRRLGVSGQTVSQMELGQRRITVDQLPALCRALDCDLGELARGADPDDIRAVGFSAS